MNLERAIKALEKRASYLEKRIKNSDKDLSFDKAELSALKFAIYRLKQPEKESHVQGNNHSGVRSIVHNE